MNWRGEKRCIGPNEADKTGSEMEIKIQHSFKKKAEQRRQRNTIKGVYDSGGTWREVEEEAEMVFIDYFKTLFTSNNNVEFQQVLDKVENRVTPEMNEALSASYTRDEIVMALKQMHPSKAPGPDGMPAFFYKKYWGVVGEDVVKHTLDILNNGGPISPINHTHIVLIPKKKHNQHTKDYRPISLCNVLYKLVSKVVSNRLKNALPCIISETQSAFVPGRLITDNVLVASEMFHYLRKKKKGIKGYMAMKLDMSKAYDRVEWAFIEGMMLKLGFGEGFVSLVMRCISSVTYYILYNDFPTKRFVPTRGLRQGDPISPFLFLICAEGLSSLLRDAEMNKAIHGVKLGRNVPPISQLFFADDSLLFTRASEADADAILDILESYELASGQKINLEKSEVSFSRNVSPNMQNMLQSKLTFTAVEGHDKYLGLPTYLDRSKKVVFQTIEDRVWKKVKGWKERTLSQAGREVLIKSIAQSIPTYAMQCFRIPESILRNITSLCRNFWWGQKGNERKMALISWDNLCLSKEMGGLGLRDMKAFNTALLAKQCWRILQNPESLAATVLKGKYFPRSNFWEAKAPSNASYTWKSILSARETLEEGVRWVIGDGRRVKFWGDKWIPDLLGGKLYSPPQNGETGATMVRDWRHNEGNGWKLEEMQQVLTGEEVIAITKVRVSEYDQEDIMQWKHTKSGDFSVRSAYYAEQQRARGEIGTSNNVQNCKLWRRIWGAEVPQKVKHVVWRVAREGLPLMDVLMRRGMQVDRICPRCGEVNELTAHMIVWCRESQLLWQLSPVRSVAQQHEDSNNMTIKEWCAAMIQKCTIAKSWELVLMIIWEIWYLRNLWVHEKKRIDPGIACQKAIQLLGEYEAANRRDKNTIQEITGTAPRWKAPPEGKYKLNTDAAVPKEGRIGMSMVVRDNVGDIMMRAGQSREHDGGVSEAEAEAILFGMKYAYEAGFRRLEVETDCLGLVELILGSRKERSILQSMVTDICALACNFQCCNFNYASRQCNMVAHSMAKLSLSFQEVKVWMEDYPQEIAPSVLLDKDEPVDH